MFDARKVIDVNVRVRNGDASVLVCSRAENDGHGAAVRALNPVLLGDVRITFRVLEREIEAVAGEDLVGTLGRAFLALKGHGSRVVHGLASSEDIDANTGLRAQLGDEVFATRIGIAIGNEPGDVDHIST